MQHWYDSFLKAYLGGSLDSVVHSDSVIWKPILALPLNEKGWGDKVLLDHRISNIEKTIYCSSFTSNLALTCWLSIWLDALVLLSLLGTNTIRGCMTRSISWGVTRRRLLSNPTEMSLKNANEPSSVHVHLVLILRVARQSWYKTCLVVEVRENTNCYTKFVVGANLLLAWRFYLATLTVMSHRETKG